MKKETLILCATLLLAGVWSICIAQNPKSIPQRATAVSTETNKPFQSDSFKLMKKGVGCLKKNMLSSRIPSTLPQIIQPF